MAFAIFSAFIISGASLVSELVSKTQSEIPDRASKTGKHDTSAGSESLN